jgi:hypothetical protein
MQAALLKVFDHRDQMTGRSDKSIEADDDEHQP